MSSVRLALLHGAQEVGDVLRVHLARVVRDRRRQVRAARGSSRRPVDHGLAGRVSSQLPPCSAARSTITEPGGMPRTISPVTRPGAFLPGTAAVVMTTSLCGHDAGHQSRAAAVEAPRPAPWRSRPCPAASAGLERQLDELRAQALDLLLHRGPHVVGLDHGAEPPRRRDRLQPRHARADHEHPRRARSCRPPSSASGTSAAGASAASSTAL